MKTAIIVFLTKTEVFECVDLFARYGLKATTTSTPKEANVGCGLAVKVFAPSLAAIKRTIAERGFRGFAGIFVREDRGGRASIYKVG